MAEFKWIIFSLFLMLQFSFSASTWSHSSFTVRAGDEATLSCASVTDDQDKCDDTTWVVSSSGKVMNFKQGQIDKEDKSKSDRLSVTQNCSLVIKNVTDEDVGAYTCKQDKAGIQQQLSLIYLSVVTMTEHKNNDQVVLNCFVSAHGWCRHTVKWLYDGKDVDESNRDLKTSKSECSVTVTFLTSYLKQKSKHHELFKCEVTDVHNRQFSGDYATTATTASPTTIRSTSTARNKWTSVKMSTSEVWGRFIIVSVGLSALIISVVTVNIWTRTKGNKTQTEENPEHHDEDEDDGTVKYENVGEPSASVRLH